MANFKPKTFTKEINGNTYTAQFNGMYACLEALDEMGATSQKGLSLAKMAKYVLENVIVDPKLSVNDFSNMDELNAVVAFGSEIMKGNFPKQEE